VIAGLKPYAEYKDSELPWLGSVPAHWNVRRTKLLLREVDARSTTGKEQLLRVSQYTGVTRRKSLDGTDAPDTRAASLVGYKRVSANDMVINIMLAWNGSMGASPFDGIVSPAYGVYRFNSGAQPKYFHELFRLPLYKGRIKTASTGVVESRLRLYSDDLGRIEALLPPPDEQAAIVRFLDHANRKIDGFIRAKRKLIALLNEQKQAIIHRAVTRGLDSSVSLTDTGAPWLGLIPAHWEVSRVKNEFHCLNNRRVPLSATQRGDMLPNYDYYGASGAIDKVQDYLFDDELLLIAEDGANLVLRNLPLAIIARGKFWVNNHAHILKPRAGNIEYLAARMECLNYLPWITGAAQPKLTKDRLMSIAIAAAPRDEQDTIMAYVTDETAPLRTAITRTEREIALMQEYRTRLTTDIVTGKFDVCAAAAELPEIAEAAADEIAIDETTDELDYEGAE
jgi:type I restriction enzyme S subunit